MDSLVSLSAVEAAARVARKQVSAVELAEACLARIELREPAIGAWAHIDRENVLLEASDCDAHLPRGPLHGVPIGIKDIIDTTTLPTEYGSAIYRGHRPQREAACVSLVRRAGGVVLGKTVTTEFALFQPGKTKNPHNLAHTPGGSSSGSAAAVADFHVPIAFSSQTSGSTIRPAAFCGVVGYKPTFNLFTPAGIKPLSASLDTLGLMTRRVEDLLLVWQVLQGQMRTPQEGRPQRPQVGLFRTPFWPIAAIDQRAAFDQCGLKLSANGYEVDEIVLPAWFSDLGEIHEGIASYEIARNLVYENHASRRRMLSQRVQQIIEEGWRVTTQKYLDMRAMARHARNEFAISAEPFNAIMTPSAPGEAPDITSTGNPVFNRVWTLLGVPAVTLPFALGTNGLPLGIQFLGRSEGDYALLEFCKNVEAVIQYSPDGK